MKKIKNTLYVFTEDAYLTLDGENVVAKVGNDALGRFPLHTLEGISLFSYAGASPALMGACCERGIRLTFFSPSGRYLADARGACTGNVLLKKAQFRASENEPFSLAVARNCILGKVYNSRWVLERAIRDHGLRMDVDAVRAASARLFDSVEVVRECDSLDSLRGIEGDAAQVYYSVFDQMILRNKDDFHFAGRSRRPPRDRVNAMLSLFYSALARDCTSALLGVGLDPSVGFMHVDRPGRDSLALDCMEELRPIFVDRFVLTVINNRVVRADDFDIRETGEVRLTDDARKKLFKAWQDRKRETLMHPFVNEKIPRGLVPNVQAQLLAKFLRGDLDAYPPFLWK